MEHQEHRLFSKSYRLKMRMKRMLHAIGSMEDRTALCLGQIPMALRARLLALGGDWAFHEDIDPGRLPYRDGSFDRVLIMDHLEWIEDDYAFMVDVHRVLKTAGMLYVDVENRKRWSVWRPLRRLFGVEERAEARVRAGYSEQDLFDILKDGFDLQEARTYSRFFVEGAETLQRMVLGAFVGGSPAEPDAEPADEAELLNRKIDRIQSILYPLFLLSAKLDWLVFYTHGYRLYAIARRRLWKPRRTPKLRDGRTLADATLNTKIGTAAPF